MPQAKKILKRLAIGFGGLLLLVLTAAGLGYGWLQSDGGRGWLARQIEAAATTPGEVELSIGRLEGNVSESLRASDIVVRDADGLWLSIAALEVSWQPWSLLNRTLEIDSLKFSEVALTRLPSGEAEAKEENGGDPLAALSSPIKVRIGSLNADRISLGQPVLGQAAELALDGSAKSEADGALATSLQLHRLDGPEARLDVELIYNPADDILTADLEAAEAPGGLLAALLEMPDLPRAALRLKGSGPLSQWEGDAMLSLGDLIEAAADITLERRGGDDLAFSMTGRSAVSAPEPEGAFALIDGRTDFALKGGWQEARRVRLDSFTAANDVLNLSIDGAFDVETRALDLNLAATAGDSPAPASLLGLERLEEASAEIALSGTLEKPQADISFAAKAVARPGFTADTASAVGKLNAESNILEGAPVFAFDLNGNVTAPRLPGQDNLDPLLGPALTWSLNGSIDTGPAILDLADLKLTTEAATITVTGQAGLNDGAAGLDVAMTVPELAALQPLTGIALGGAARLAGPVTVESFGQRLTAELAGRWDQPSSETALVAAAAGDGMDLATRLAFDNGELRIEEVTGRSDIANIDASLAISPAGELSDAGYSVRLPEAAVLADALGVEVTGAATVEGEAAGPFDALAVSGAAKLAGLTIEDQELRDLTAGYQLRIAGSDVDGPVTLALTSPFGPLEASSELQLRADTLGLTDLEAGLPDTRITGDVILPLDGGEPIAALQADLDDLGPWLAVAGLSGNGKGRINVRLNQSGEDAPVLATANLTGVALRPDGQAVPLTIENLTAALQAQDLALAGDATFEITAEQLRWQDLEAENLGLTGEGNPADLSFTLTGSGAWVEPLEVSAAGRVTQEDERLTLALTQAEGQLFGEALTLRDTATLTLAPEETRLTGLDLASGETRLTADAAFAARDIAVDATLDGLPLQTVDRFWATGIDGRISAKASLQGSFDDPRGSAALSATGLQPSGSTDLPPLELAAEADWRGGRLNLAGQLGGADIAAADFRAELPLTLTAEGAAAFPARAPITGNLNWSGDITTLLLFVPLPQHRLKGAAAISLDASGSLEAPKVNGSVILNNGRYENLDTGTILNDIALQAEITDDRITLASLTANDGAGGSVTGKGQALADPAQGFPFDVAIQLDKLHALRRDDVTAVAGGSVEINGTADASRVTGRLTAETVEVSLLNNLPPNVVSLDVIEVKGGVVQDSAEDQKKAPVVDAALDIVIDMPRRIFVRGRGLDSEWAGRISVQGSAADPLVTGSLDLVRGRLSVVGKPFALRSGRVILPESQNAEPSLDVTAVYEGPELEVTARLSGPLTQPELVLTSTPEVPRDEIISRVLFNKSAAGLTAAEAAQLAIALRDLTGNGGGADILGFARRTLGVDVLRIEAADGQGPALEAGKYLTDEVYVGVKQGASSQSSAATVEVELTPNITVESEVTGSGANKSGVRFQWDY